MSYRVLIIDDDPDDAELAAQSLIRSFPDCHVSVAFDGDAGLDLLRSGEVFHAVLLDWNMPRVSGFEFLEAWKAESNDDLPIFVLSAQDIPRAAKRRSRDSGVRSFFTKPLRREAVQTLRPGARVDPESPTLSPPDA